jgi:peptidoglycan/LPS O-acetylase OafA/YrhL
MQRSSGAELPVGVAAVASPRAHAAARSDARAGPGLLESLQWLRAAAALAVIGWHLVWVARAFPGALPRLPHALACGYAGVDLFFAISGYVICHICAGRPFSLPDFARRRWLRIAPLYALFTGTAAAIAWWRPQWGGEQLDPVYLLHSLSLLPMRGLPFLDVGWSLEHELIFYALVAALFCAGASRWLPHALALLFCAGVAWHGVGLGAGRFDLHLLSLYHAEFLAGVLVFRCRDRLRALGWRLPLCAGAAGFLGVAAWLAPRALAPDGSLHVPTQPAGLDGVVRVLGYGSASALLLAGMLEAERCGALARVPRTLGSALRRIGDASYVLYLSHFFVYSALGTALAALAAPAWLAAPSLVLALGAAVAFAVAVHVALERPLLRALRARG